MSETTPTRDEAVPTGWKLVPVEPTIEMLASQTGYTIEGLRQEPLRQRDLKLKYAAMLDSAPAPASGRVDVEALTYRVANAKLGEGSAVRCEGPTDFEKDQARAWVKRVLSALASLSPAATPVSEENNLARIAKLRAEYVQGPDSAGPGDFPVVKTPTAEGYFWARWLKPAPGTADDGEGCDPERWEVVSVFENSLDTECEEYLMVMVPGVEQSQPLENFEWGAEVVR